MGAFLDHPKIDKINHSGNGEIIGQNFQYGVASMQGWRIDMEDAHHIVVSITNQPPFKDWSFFAVFDGHAGNRVAQHSSQNLLDFFLKTDEFKKVLSEPNLNSLNLSENVKQLIKDGLIKGFLQLDQSMGSLHSGSGEPERSGTTATCVILTPEYVFFANLGDSRCVLSRKSNNIFATEDHKPYLEKEKNRIEKAGGSVMIQRVNGSLAVSRALGDFEYKNSNALRQNEQLVSPEPDVYIVKRDMIDDEFLILACDGIFDVLDNLELCEWVRTRLKVTDDLNEVTNRILDGCLSKGSRDNMTMILVAFDTAPKVDPIAVQEEAEFDKRVMELINEFFDSFNENNTKEVIDAELITSYLKEKEKEFGQRPGGIHFARTQIHKVLESKQNSTAPASTNPSVPPTNTNATTTTALNTSGTGSTPTVESTAPAK